MVQASQSHSPKGTKEHLALLLQQSLFIPCGLKGIQCLLPPDHSYVCLITYCQTHLSSVKCHVSAISIPTLEWESFPHQQRKQKPTKTYQERGFLKMLTILMYVSFVLLFFPLQTRVLGRM